MKGYSTLLRAPEQEPLVPYPGHFFLDLFSMIPKTLEV